MSRSAFCAGMTLSPNAFGLFLDRVGLVAAAGHVERVDGVHQPIGEPGDGLRDRGDALRRARGRETPQVGRGGRQDQVRAMSSAQLASMLLTLT